MAGKFILTVVAVVALLVQTTTAATYTVGDTLGWTVPPTPQTYLDWASPITFRAGDILVFNFASNAHDVATVTKEAYGSCNTNSPITMQTVGPAAFPLNNTGEYNFICTFGVHCSLGQKFSINVTSATPTTPAPTSPAPAVPTTPAPTSPAPATPTTPAPTSPAPATPTTPSPMGSPAGSPNPTVIPPPGSPAGSPNPTVIPPPGSPAGSPNTTVIPPPGTSTPPPPEATTTPTPPGMAPPPPSSATRTMTVVGFMGTLMAVAMGLAL